MADEDLVRSIVEAMREQNQGVVESTAALVRTIDRIATRLDDVDRRLMRVESASYDRDMARMTEDLSRLTAEVAGLSTWRAHVGGAMGLFNWVRSSWPLFVSIGGLLALYLELRRRG